MQARASCVRRGSTRSSRLRGVLIALRVDTAVRLVLTVLRRVSRVLVGGMWVVEAHHRLLIVWSAKLESYIFGQFFGWVFSLIVVPTCVV